MTGIGDRKDTGTHLWAVLHLEFNEAEKVLLIHAARMVHVSIHFASVVEVAMERRREHIRVKRVKTRPTDEGHAIDAHLSIAET